MIIGVCGHIGAGKDTIGERLVEGYGFQKINMSDALKHEVLRTLRGTLMAYLVETESPRGASLEDVKKTWTPERLEARMNRIIFHEKKPTSRLLLQEWGTQLRRFEDAHYWVDQWAKSMGIDSTRKVVCTDVRFDNERALIEKMGGEIIKVTRPGHDGFHIDQSQSGWLEWLMGIVRGPDNTVHESEIAADSWQGLTRFRNDGDVHALYAQVDVYMASRWKLFPCD